MSALARHGIWAPEATLLHVAVAQSASRLRHPDDRRVRLAEIAADVVVHWVGDPRRGIDDLVTALADMSRCSSRGEFFAAVESALHIGALTAQGRAELRRSVSRRRRRLVDLASPLSESGGESLLRLALLDAGVRFRQQVWIPGVGRVDFLIGEWLIVEADSRAHHSDPTADRRRDAAASAAGYRTLRFMYTQIRWELPSVLMAIRAAQARGDHRRTVVLQEIP